jgi:hypothetical protein
VSESEIYLFFADTILVVHFVFVAFVVFGFLAIVIGSWTGWRWIRNQTFRNLHLFAIAFVVLQTWLGRMCPLTMWETSLRRSAGEPGYEQSFIQHWLHKIMYFDADPWVFTVLYTVFGIFVLVAWLVDRRGNRV